MMIIYFAGCMATYRMETIAKSTINILIRAGIPFKHLGERERCCGSVLLRTGNIRQARNLMRYNLQAFTEIDSDNAPTIVTSCAGCYRALKDDYPRYVRKQFKSTQKLDFEVLHVAVFIQQLVADGKLMLSELNAKVTYHDPCHLGRHMGIYDAPRKLLKSIPALELVEMERSRENARCCGAGGGVRAAFKAASQRIAKYRIKDAEEAGANILISACPFCVFNLREAATCLSSKVEVLDLSELIARLID
jgi:Fe-S oxidoreductase